MMEKTQAVSRGLNYELYMSEVGSGSAQGSEEPSPSAGMFSPGRDGSHSEVTAEQCYVTPCGLPSVNRHRINMGFHARFVHP